MSTCSSSCLRIFASNRHSGQVARNAVSKRPRKWLGASFNQPSPALNLLSHSVLFFFLSSHNLNLQGTRTNSSPVTLINYFKPPYPLFSSLFTTCTLTPELDLYIKDIAQSQVSIVPSFFEFLPCFPHRGHGHGPTLPEASPATPLELLYSYRGLDMPVTQDLSTSSVQPLCIFAPLSFSHSKRL